jgi:O-antigen/teichoic acid export membrane protein
VGDDIDTIDNDHRSGIRPGMVQPVLLGRNKLLHRWLGPVEGLKRQLATDMAGIFMLSLTQKMLMLVASILLARLMRPHNYGVYAAIMAAVTLVGVPASLGLPILAVREMAAYRACKEWALMKGVLIRSIQIMSGPLLLLALLIWMLEPWFSRSSDFNVTLIWTAFTLLLLTQFGALRGAILRGLHHVILGLAPEMVIAPLILIFGIGTWTLCIHTPLTPLIAVLMRLGGASAAFLIGGVWLWRRLPAPMQEVSARYQTAHWPAAVGPLALVSSLSVVTAQTDVVMLTVLKGPTAAGIYQVASRGAELVAFAVTISSLALQPTLARLHVAGELQRLRRVAMRTAWIMFSGALCAAIVFIVAGQTLLVHIFGSSYTPAALPLGILSGGWVLITVFGPGRDTLLMTGGERVVALIVVLSSIANVILNLLLIPMAGPEGAAVSTAASLVGCQLGYALGVYKRLGIRVMIA